MVYFSPFIQSTISGYLNFTISVFIGLKNSAQLIHSFQNNFQFYFNSILSLAFAIAILLMPLFVFLFFKRKQSSLETPEVKTRFGSLYEGLRIKKFSAVMYNVVFFFRRILISFSIVFLGSFPLVQTSIQISTSFLVLVYLIKYKPYLEKRLLYLEIYNEASLLSCSYCLLVFSMGIDSQMTTKIGWFMITCLLLNIVINYLNMMVIMIKENTIKVKAYCERRRKSKLTTKEELFQNAITQQEIFKNESFCQINQTYSFLVQQSPNLISLKSNTDAKLEDFDAYPSFQNIDQAPFEKNPYRRNILLLKVRQQHLEREAKYREESQHHANSQTKRLYQRNEPRNNVLAQLMKEYTKGFEESKQASKEEDQPKKRRLKKRGKKKKKNTKRKRADEEEKEDQIYQKFYQRW